MSDTGKQDIVIVTPVYDPTMEEDRRFALHQLWEAKDRGAFYAPLAAKARWLRTECWSSSRVVRSSMKRRWWLLGKRVASAGRRSTSLRMRPRSPLSC